MLKGALVLPEPSAEQVEITDPGGQPIAAMWRDKLVRLLDDNLLHGFPFNPGNREDGCDASSRLSG